MTRKGRNSSRGSSICKSRGIGNGRGGWVYSTKVPGSKTQGEGAAADPGCVPEAKAEMGRPSEDLSREDTIGSSGPRRNP